MQDPFCDIVVCDEIVRNYLPQVRAELVSRLVCRKGISQRAVAKYMGLSPAAVSQYVSRKRGCRFIEMSPDLDDVIEKWAIYLITGDGSVTICDICRCVHNNCESNKSP